MNVPCVLCFEDNTLSFEELLGKDNSYTVHERNLQYLAIEIFKVKMNLSPEIMADIFQFENDSTYNLRSVQKLKRRNLHTTSFGIESISNLGAKIWNLLPDYIKTLQSLSEFKTKIKTWSTDKCPCNLCKTYLANIGYI